MGALAFNITTGHLDTKGVAQPVAIFAKLEIAIAYIKEGSRKHPSVTFYVNYQPAHKTMTGVTYLYKSGERIN